MTDRSDEAIEEGGRELRVAIGALIAKHGEDVVHMATMLANQLRMIDIALTLGLPEEDKRRHMRRMVDDTFVSYIDVVELDRKLVYEVAQGICDALNRIQTDAVIASGALAQGEPHGSSKP